MADVDLTTLEAVREFLQRQDGAVEDDPVIATLITQCSAQMINEFEREFAPATTATRHVRVRPHPCGTTIVSLAPWDLRTVTAVVVDTGLGTEQTLTSDLYEPTWDDRAAGTYLGLEIRSVYAVPRRSRRNVAITGDWGMSSVPEDVELACKLFVQSVIRRDVQAYGSAGFAPDETGPSPFPLGIPNRVLGMLSGYRRFGF